MLNFQFNFCCRSVCINSGTKELSLFIMDSLSSESEVRGDESSCRFSERGDHIRVPLNEVKIYFFARNC